MLAGDAAAEGDDANAEGVPEPAAPEGEEEGKGGDGRLKCFCR